jgi:hypothetical protein
MLVKVFPSPGRALAGHHDHAWITAHFSSIGPECRSDQRALDLPVLVREDAILIRFRQVTGLAYGVAIDNNLGPDGLDCVVWLTYRSNGTAGLAWSGKRRCLAPLRLA